MQTRDDDVRVEVYRFFVERGRPPVIPEIGRALSLQSDAVEASLRQLADARVLVLAPGTPYIWMANPLCALPSPFAVRARGRDWWGICIWDALGIVAMLGGDGAVSTHCPDCLEPLELRVAGGEIEPSESVIHFAVPAAHWWDDIGFN